MARMLLTDISVRALKPSEQYETFFDTKLAGFGVRVGKRSKTFVVVRGKRRERVTLGRYPDLSLSDARTAAKKLLATEPAAKITRRTFEKARDDYLSTNFEESQSDHKYHVKLIFNKHFAELNSKQLADITDEDVDTLLNRIKGPSAKLHAFRAIRAFFNWCTKSPRRYIHISPIHGYEPPSSDKKGTRTLTNEELKAVWNASKSGNRLVFRLMMLWGTRNTETVAIMLNWVSGDVLVIPGEVTKNGRDHAIPLTPLAKQVLSLRNTEPYYFPGNKEDEHLTPHALAKLFRQVKKEANVSGFTLRDIRRTFRTVLAQLKVPREIAEVLINHAPPVLDEIYDRWHRLPEKKAALAKYEKYMLKLVTA